MDMPVLMAVVLILVLWALLLLLIWPHVHVIRPVSPVLQITISTVLFASMLLILCIWVNVWLVAL